MTLRGRLGVKHQVPINLSALRKCDNSSCGNTSERCDSQIKTHERLRYQRVLFGQHKPANFRKMLPLTKPQAESQWYNKKTMTICDGIWRSSKLVLEAGSESLTDIRINKNTREVKNECFLMSTGHNFDFQTGSLRGRERLANDLQQWCFPRLALSGMSTIYPWCCVSVSPLGVVRDVYYISLVLCICFSAWRCQGCLLYIPGVVYLFLRLALCSFKGACAEHSHIVLCSRY